MTGDPGWAHRHARLDDPDTSHAAARTVDPRALAGRLLAAITDRPSTVEEAAASTGIDRWAASKRVSDLRIGGLVEDSGVRRPGASGRAQIVWQAVPDDGGLW